MSRPPYQKNIQYHRAHICSTAVLLFGYALCSSRNEWAFSHKRAAAAAAALLIRFPA